MFIICFFAIGNVFYSTEWGYKLFGQSNNQSELLTQTTTTLSSVETLDGEISIISNGDRSNVEGSNVAGYNSTYLEVSPYYNTSTVNCEKNNILRKTRKGLKLKKKSGKLAKKHEEKTLKIEDKTSLLITGNETVSYEKSESPLIFVHKVNNSIEFEPLDSETSKDSKFYYKASEGSTNNPPNKNNLKPTETSNSGHQAPAVYDNLNPNKNHMGSDDNGDVMNNKFGRGNFFM